MKKKKLILLSGAFILAGLMLVGCGSGNDSDSKGQAGDSLTLSSGKLKVGMEVGYPPMEYLDEDGVTEVGFDVEVAKEISKRLNLDLEIVDTAWDGIFSSHDYQLAASTFKRYRNNYLAYYLICILRLNT